MTGDDDRDRALDATVAATPPAAAASARRAPAPGISVGRYQFVSRLGAGAMGVVWAARDPQLDRAVAIKLVHPALAEDPEAAARLLREARAMAKVSHRNVVAVHDAGQDGPWLFIAMELVDGTNLGQRIARRTPAEVRDWRRWLTLALDAGRGLAAAHAAGVIHRDFKPENVLVDRHGRVCVGDFGVAELGAARRSPSLRFRPADLDDAVTLDALTTTGALVGTPAYMSPEQLRGASATERSDQFAFCVTVWEVLFGQRPFAVRPAPGEPALDALRRAIARGDLEGDGGSGVPRRYRDALARGLAADPAARWPELPALLAALTPRRRWRAPLAVGVSVVALAATIAGGLLMRATPAAATGWRAERRFPVELKAQLALAADGRHVALTSADRVLARSLDGRDTRTLAPAPGEVFERGVFVGDAIHVAVRAGGAVRLRAWQPMTGVTAELGVVRPGVGRWLGHADDGELFEEPDGDGDALVVVRGDARRVVTRLAGKRDVMTVAPGGRRLAILESTTFAGRIAVVDLATGATLRSAPIVELSGLAWIDDHRLLYTTGTIERPAVHEVAVAAAFGAPRRRYQGDLGWFGQIAAAGRHAVFVDSTSSFRARLVTGGVTTDLDPARIAAALAWMPDGSWLAWNRTTGDLERRDDRGAALATIDADIHGEPGNATRAGDTVIVSMRRQGGRELSATALADGRRLWTHAVGASLAARCAADDHPPCFAIVAAAAGGFAVRALEPTTGAIGAVALYAAPELIDLAVAPGGDELLILDGTRALRRLTLATGAVTAEDLPLSVGRGVAYHPAGGVVVAGSRGPSSYPVLWLHAGAATLIAQGESELLFMPRPAPSGDRWLIMGRMLLPELYELVPAR